MKAEKETRQDSLPKILPGAVCEQRVRCGKRNCKCRRGEPHVAYYRFWQEGGRQRKAYVRRADLEATRAACAAWGRAEGYMRQLTKGPAGASVRREIRATLRSALAGAPPGVRERAARRYR